MQEILGARGLGNKTAWQRLPFATLPPDCMSVWTRAVRHCKKNFVKRSGETLIYALKGVLLATVPFDRNVSMKRPSSSDLGLTLINEIYDHIGIVDKNLRTLR